MNKSLLKIMFALFVLANGAVIAKSVVEVPADVPMDVLKFDRVVVEKTLDSLIDSGSMAGAAVLVFKENKEVMFHASGFADVEAKKRWRRDTLVALYSMTKPVTGVTLMTLYEEGLFDFEEPLSKYLPEFEHTMVIVGLNDDGSPILEKPKRPIKVIDIFRHTACFGYGWEDHPAAQFMNAAQVLDPSKPLSQFTRDLAELPLYCHPGTQWKYGVSTDVQARLAEVVSGKPFDELVTDRVLKPLALSNTRYFTRKKDLPRLATIYQRTDDGKLNPLGPENSFTYAHRTQNPNQINGGHGLVGSIDDYMRFALMLQNEGRFDGVQILKPETVDLMRQDHLPEGLIDKDFLPSKGQMGFGLNFAVRLAAPETKEEPFGVVGEFFWDGAASTLFWVDPKNDITVVLLTQVTPFDLQAQTALRSAVYEAFGIKQPIHSNPR